MTKVLAELGLLRPLLGSQMPPSPWSVSNLFLFFFRRVFIVMHLNREQRRERVLPSADFLSRCPP